jgi:hypothetical protein
MLNVDPFTSHFLEWTQHVQLEQQNLFKMILESGVLTWGVQQTLAIHLVEIGVQLKFDRDWMMESFMFNEDTYNIWCKHVDDAVDTIKSNLPVGSFDQLIGLSSWLPCQDEENEITTTPAVMNAIGVH